MRVPWGLLICKYLHSQKLSSIIMDHDGRHGDTVGGECLPSSLSNRLSSPRDSLSRSPLWFAATCAIPLHFISAPVSSLRFKMAGLVTVGFSWAKEVFGSDGCQEGPHQSRQRWFVHQCIRWGLQRSMEVEIVHWSPSLTHTHTHIDSLGNTVVAWSSRPTCVHSDFNARVHTF